MEQQEFKEPQVITVRPATLFAFIKVLQLIISTIGFLFLAWWIYPGLIWLSLLSLLMVCYRFMYIRNSRYIITPEVIRISRGIFFKRTDQVELYRVKGAHVAAA